MPIGAMAPFKSVAHPLGKGLATNNTVPKALLVLEPPLWPRTYCRVHNKAILQLKIALFVWSASLHLICICFLVASSLNYYLVKKFSSYVTPILHWAEFIMTWSQNGLWVSSRIKWHSLVCFYCLLFPKRSCSLFSLYTSNWLISFLTLSSWFMFTRSENIFLCLFLLKCHFAL